MHLKRNAMHYFLLKNTLNQSAVNQLEIIADILRHLRKFYREFIRSDYSFLNQPDRFRIELSGSVGNEDRFIRGLIRLHAA